MLTAGEGQQGVTFGMIVDTLFKYSDETVWEQGMKAKFYALSGAEIPFFTARYDCTTPFEEVHHLADLSVTTQSLGAKPETALANAAARALGVFELLENVAAYLEPWETFVLRRVNKTWQNVLEQQHYTITSPFEQPCEKNKYGRHPLTPPFCDSIQVRDVSCLLQHESEPVLELFVVFSHLLLEHCSKSPTFHLGTWRALPAFHHSTRKAKLRYHRGYGLKRVLVRRDVEASTGCITLGDLTNAWLRIVAEEGPFERRTGLICFKAVVYTNGEAVQIDQLALKPQGRPWQLEYIGDEAFRLD
ncbi:hypothetical protein HII31_12242 [Pseudocercospora fuligena]|uniref:Uncharacterized protein n=1 Tax=Pseudocercospora fuligena TaxID=685502 RepID=A0A8H6R8C6_9PEZI|nr:hypothetical protein HII31_12242 [Pseudocercospora fuligena]